MSPLLKEIWLPFSTWSSESCQRSSFWQGKMETEYNKMVIFLDISYITNTALKTHNERVS